MSLVFGAVVPHPPILIPSIGKEEIKKIKNTEEALKKLEQDLYVSKPDIVIVISPHGEIHPSAFTINISNHYEVNFESFGDFSTKLEFKGDTVLIPPEKYTLEEKFPINIISEPNLDHGLGVPLFYLAQHLDAKIIPMYFSLLDNQAHLEFGKALKEMIMKSNKRIAVIASGDMSHCLTKDSPVKCDPAGKEFDEKIIELLKNSDTQGVVNLDHKLIEKASECGLRSILILLGILNNIDFETEVLNYEAPFGVGYLVANLKLK